MLVGRGGEVVGTSGTNDTVTPPTTAVGGMTWGEQPRCVVEACHYHGSHHRIQKVQAWGDLWHSGCSQNLAPSHFHGCHYFQLNERLIHPLPLALTSTDSSFGDKILNFICYTYMTRSRGILIDWGWARAWRMLFLIFLINCTYAPTKSQTLYYKFHKIILWLNSHHHSVNMVIYYNWVW